MCPILERVASDVGHLAPHRDAVDGGDELVAGAYEGFHVGEQGQRVVLVAEIGRRGGVEHQRPDPSALASYVRSHTTDEQRVFVWGSYPEVLLAADRLPAGALVHSDFVTGRSGGREDPAVTLELATPGALQLMLADLRAHP